MIVASATSWQDLLGDQSNIVTELTTGRLRCVNPRDTHRLRSDEIHAVAALLGLASIPVAHRQATGTTPATAGELSCVP